MNKLVIASAARPAARAALALGILTLAACGGGGGSPGDPAPPAAPTAFVDVVPKAGFSWATAQQAAPRIALSRASGQALGNLSLLVSDYVCDGKSPNPVRGSRFTALALTPSQQAALSVTLDLHALQLQVPASAGRVLAEVVDNQRKVALYSRLVVPAALSSVSVSVPDTPSLASCASPG
jgi:hypothetical protein